MYQLCYRALVLIEFLLLCLVAIGVGVAEASEPARRALLIGINDYQAEKVSDLNGAVNDVEQLSHVLRVRFGFPAANVKTLLNEQATRDNILTTLREFVGKTEPDDIVFIHFSGHGSQAPDIDGDEFEDNRDETIVPHDGRTAGVSDITDDELEAILAGLKTDNAVVVLDSCHSGTGTRSLHVQTRSIPMDNRRSLYETAPTRGAPATLISPELGYVLMTGAASDQNALDGPIENKYYGLFSYSLSKSLDAGPSATPSEIMAGVREEFLRIQHAWGGMRLPNPQLEGNEKRLSSALYAPRLDSSSTAVEPTRAYLEARPGQAGEIVLLGGSQLGSAIGSIWGIYEHDENDFSGDALTTATVVRALGNDAIAKLSGNVNVPAKARAVEVIPASTNGTITVDLRAEADFREPLMNQVAQKLENVEFVSSKQFAQFIVEIVANDVAVYGAAGLELQDRFAWTGPESSAVRLVETLSKSQAAAEMTSLSNQSSEIELSVDVVGAETQRGVGVVGAATTAQYTIRRNNDTRSHKNSLMLEVGASQNVFVTIASVNSEGSVGVLFPNDYQESKFVPDGLVAAGTTVRIPDSYADGNRAGFHWDYAPPAGHDVIQVFAAADVETAQKIRQFIAELAEETQARRMPSTRSVSGRAPATEMWRLRSELGDRGIGLVKDDNAAGDAPVKSESKPDWTVSAVRIEVLE